MAYDSDFENMLCAMLRLQKAQWWSVEFGASDRTLVEQSLQGPTKPKLQPKGPMYRYSRM